MRKFTTFLYTLSLYFVRIAAVFKRISLSSFKPKKLYKEGRDFRLPGNFATFRMRN